MENSFDRLLNQVDSFIRKYYTNKLIKGIIFFFGLFLLSYLFVSVLEYLGRFNSLIRGVFLFGFILFNLFILVRYIIIPFAKLYSFGSRINRVQASEIIGSFFPTISDRLKNTLQLNELLLSNDGNLELLSATINQRSEQLNTIPFTGAIKFEDNKKYLKFIVPLLLVLFSIVILFPNLLIQGTERVINFNEEFKPIAPFSFIVNSSKLVVEEGNDVEVILNLNGSFLPDIVYINCVNGKFIMTKNAKNSFSAIIKKPKNSASFYFTANEFVSKKFNYKVLGKSVVSKLDASIFYPSYLGKKNVIINNSGDLIVPEGTKIEWNILTKNTKSTRVCFNKENTEYNDNGFVFSRVIRSNAFLSLYLRNKYFTKIDSTFIHVTVVKDAYPTIVLNETIDSVADGVRYFQGDVGDDYGLKSLRFVYTLISEKGIKKTNSISVKPVKGTRVNFDFAVDFRRENVQLNDRIEYYFTVSDNDGFNGSKSTRSNLNTYKLPSLEQLNEQRGEDQQKNKDDLSKLLKETKEFQKNVEKLKKEILNSNSNDWNKVNKATQLKEDQKKLVESLENLKSEMNQSTKEKNQLSEINKEITDKQDLIEKLLEELMDDELKKLLEELEELMKQNNKEELKDKMEQIGQTADDMKKQLDRSLEMLKKLQVNEKIDDIEKELKNLSKDQEKLKKQVEDKKIEKTDASDKQDALNKKFDNIKKDLEEVKELNKALDNPLPLTEFSPLEEKISENLNDAKESLDQGKEKNAGQNQQNAADEMNELAQQLNQSQEEANKKEAEEDMDAVRNILESLMTLSFNQETLISKFKKINPTNPVYKNYGRVQRDIVTDTEIVKDSLLALAKRQAKIASFIDKELNAIKDNHELAINSIDDHRVKDLEKHQQLTMTSYNNLALLLNEALQQMQSDMQSQQKGSGSCSKPGSGKPKPGSMSPGDMKEMLKKQLEKLKKGSSPGEGKEGDKPGNKPGDKPGGSMPGLGNKEIAKMAAEQTAMRQRLEQMRNELNKDGKGLGNKLSPLIKELEEQEKALINKRTNTDLVKRQQEILSRLLESEKALLERGFEEKRESKSGQNENNGNKIRFDEYNKLKIKQIDLIQTVDPSFNKYYKDKANQFFNLFE